MVSIFTTGIPHSSQCRPTGPQAGWSPDTLVENHADRVYRFLLAMTRNPDTARDLSQETFLKVQAAWQTETADDSECPEEPGVAFVLTVARNTALSFFRRQTLERRHLTVVNAEDLPEMAQASGQGNPLGDLERSELRTALLEALACLSEELRATFLLSEVEGLSYAEIAASLGCSPGTVASRKHNAVKKLRNILERSGHAL